MNEQILGKQFLIAKIKNGLEIYVDAPDSNSLSEKYNKYVNEAFSKLKEQKLPHRI